jgi:hypothetical protein
MNRKSEIIKTLMSELSVEQLGEIFFTLRNYGYEILGNDPAIGRHTDQIMSVAIDKKNRSDLRSAMSEVLYVLKEARRYGESAAMEEYFRTKLKKETAAVFFRAVDGVI